MFSYILIILWCIFFNSKHFNVGRKLKCGTKPEFLNSDVHRQIWRHFLKIAQNVATLTTLRGQIVIVFLRICYVILTASCGFVVVQSPIAFSQWLRNTVSEVRVFQETRYWLRKHLNDYSHVWLPSEFVILRQVRSFNIGVYKWFFLCSAAPT